MRVACRRMRSSFQSFRALLDRSRTDDLVVELRWLAGELGGARDLEVQEARIVATSPRCRPSWRSAPSPPRPRGSSPPAGPRPPPPPPPPWTATATSRCSTPWTRCWPTRADRRRGPPGRRDPPGADRQGGAARAEAPAGRPRPPAGARARPGAARDAQGRQAAALRRRGERARAGDGGEAAGQGGEGAAGAAGRAPGLVRGPRAAARAGCCRGDRGGNGVAFGWLLRDEQARAEGVEADVDVAWTEVRRRARAVTG